MRTIFFVVLIVFTRLCFAQNDVFPDYRSKKELFTRVVEKEIRSDLASFSMGGIDESIGKLPLKSLPISKATPASISFANESIQVTINSAPFDASKHKLGFYDKKYLTRIDNKPYFGDYGKVPLTTVQSVEVIIDRDTINIPSEALSDLANPIFSFVEKGVQKTQNKVLLSADGHRIYVYMLKPEKGGSYEVTWVIKDRKYLRRVVDFGFLKD